ncbi:MAG: acyl-CoA dehydrogenase family protein [Methyloligellaceae bacterium]
MYDLNLTSEQIEFRDTIREFVREKITPAATQSERLEPFAKPLLIDLVDEVSQLGVRGLLLSETSGGIGADELTACLVLEELAAGDVDLAVTLATSMLAASHLLEPHLPNERVAEILSRFGEDEQYHLAPAEINKRSRDGWSYHRADGVDREPQLSLEQSDDGWRINGTMTEVPNAEIAKLLIFRFSGQGLCLIPRGTQGLALETDENPFAKTTEDGEPAIRWQHGSLSDCIFKDCEIPGDCFIAEDKGNADIFTAFNETRKVLMAAINLGVARAAYDSAIDYAKIRYQGGYNIIEHQGIGDKIAEMTVGLEASRTLVWKAAWIIRHPEAIADGSVADLPYGTMAQSHAAETANRVALLAAEHFGAMGVMRDMPLQKYVNDSFMFLNADGHDSATRLKIAETVAGFEPQ